jgi:hypothetical protein
MAVECAGVDKVLPRHDIGSSNLLIPCCRCILRLRRMRSSVTVKFCTERLGQGNERTCGHQPIVFSHRARLKMGRQSSSLVSAEPLWKATWSVLLLLISYCGASVLAWWV